MDAQWSRYLYDGNVFGHPADYNEYYLFLHYQDFISSRISFADNYYNLGSYAIDYQLTGRYPLTDYLEFSTSFGYSQTKAVLGSDYPYWNVGGTYFYKFVSLDFRYIDATETSIDKAVEAIKHESYDPPLIGLPFYFLYPSAINQNLWPSLILLLSTLIKSLLLDIWLYEWLMNLLFLFKK